MNAEARARLKQLLEGQRVLSLAVLVEGEAHLGLLPFAVLPDHSGVLVHVSTLAKHTRGLSEPGTVALLIHQSEEAVGDPLQVPRITLRAQARELRRSTEEYESGKLLYLERFPSAAVTFDLGDFKLFELKFLDGRYVESFARAMNVSSEELRELSPREEPKPKAKEEQPRRSWRMPRD